MLVKKDFEIPSIIIMVVNTNQPSVIQFNIDAVHRNVEAYLEEALWWECGGAVRFPVHISTDFSFCPEYETG